MLGGGASLGAIQVGVLQALSEHDVAPDLVAGTSVGSLNGAALARDPTSGPNRRSHVLARMTTAQIFPGGLLAQVRTLHAQTVDHVVILDKGRLITSAPLAELTARSRSAVILRTPDADRLRADLTSRGIDATVTGPEQITATDTTPEAVGRVIGTIGLVIYEMRLEEPNLDDIFFSLTNTEGASS